MDVIKPLKGEPLTFWFCGGELLWRGSSHRGLPLIQPIDRFQAESLLDLYNDEAKAAWTANEMKVVRHATKMWRQLVEALDAHDGWTRLHAPADQHGRAA